MGETPQYLPPGVDESMLARAVGALLRVQAARVGQWQGRSIWEPRVTYTRGVYLFSGTALDDG